MKKAILVMSVMALLASCTQSSTEKKSTCDTCVVKTDSTQTTTDTTAKKDTVAPKVD